MCQENRITRKSDDMSVHSDKSRHQPAASNWAAALALKKNYCYKISNAPSLKNKLVTSDMSYKLSTRTLLSMRKKKEKKITFLPCALRARASWTATVLFPTPPLPDNITIT